jgi:hypothetical protein
MRFGVQIPKAAGANIVNIHHGNELNPYINYPFLATDKLKSYVRQAHEKNVKIDGLYLDGIGYDWEMMKRVRKVMDKARPVPDRLPLRQRVRLSGLAHQPRSQVGYWSKNCPVKTNHRDVLATVYSRPGKALISIASWAKEPVRVKREVDWKALGIDQRKADLTAPTVPGLQEGRDFQRSGEIPVEQGKGWLLLLSER